MESAVEYCCDSYLLSFLSIPVKIEDQIYLLCGYNEYNIQL